MFLVKASYYDCPHAKQFIADVELAGFEPFHYPGRRWQGPAIEAIAPGDGHGATSVPCQHDSFGKRYAVFPEEPCKLNAEGRAAYQAYLDRDDGED